MPPAAELVADKGSAKPCATAGRTRKGRHPTAKVQYHYDKTVYRQRNIIERMFCRLKDWRRIASKALRDWLAERGTTAVIPPRKNRKVQYHYDKTVYRQRNIIERMFCRLKDWRRIATRFDRNIKNFIAAIALAAAVIWWL